MFDMQGCGMTVNGDGVNRRDFIRAGSLGIMGLGRTDGPVLKRARPAKAVIRLWMDGGPAQTDTFDPKPEAGTDFSGPFRHPVETNVKGIRIGELLPLMAKQADKYTIIRSMTHTHNSHETGAHVMRTGAPLSSDTPHLALGALPPCITLTDLPGAFSKAGSLPGEAGQAFDLSREKDSLRDRYGRHHFGQSCLLARRLVEHGVSFITVNMGGWDTHVENFRTMRKLLPVLDSGFATLLQDLADRGLLARTLVVWCGEFGRTPRVACEPPWFGGRHHFGNCFSAVVAGGGFKGGQVIGASDRTGESVQDRPVYPWDLGASIDRLLDMDPDDGRRLSSGGFARVTPAVRGCRSGGVLAEIMPGASAPVRMARE